MRRRWLCVPLPSPSRPSSSLHLPIRAPALLAALTALACVLGFADVADARGVTGTLGVSLTAPAPGAQLPALSGTVTIAESCDPSSEDCAYTPRITVTANPDTVGACSPTAPATWTGPAVPSADAPGTRVFSATIPDVVGAAEGVVNVCLYVTPGDALLGWIGMIAESGAAAPTPKPPIAKHPGVPVRLTRRGATVAARRALTRRAAGFRHGRHRRLVCSRRHSAVTIRCAATWTHARRHVRARVSVTEHFARYATTVTVTSRRTS